MTKKRHWAAGAVFKNTPTRHEANPKLKPLPQLGTAIPCYKCGVAGHTLVKVDGYAPGHDVYMHQNTVLCERLAKEMQRARLERAHRHDKGRKE